MMKKVDFTTQDGFKLHGCLFEGDNSKAGIIINSATAVDKEYYQAFAEYLCEQGYTIITYDYRGIGESQAISKMNNANILSMRAWGEQDFESIIQWALKSHPNLPWHCIGHSVGGQLVGLAPSNTKLVSTYCVSAQNGYWKNWDTFKKPKVFITWYGLIPFFSLTFGRVPAFLLGGNSLPAPIALEWARWCRNPNFITDNQGKPIREYFEQYSSKMCFVVIKDDLDFAPEKSVKALQKLYTSANSKRHMIDPKEFGIKKIGHFGFFKRQHKTTLWPESLKWFEQFPC